jgi:hypothetical protein
VAQRGEKRSDCVHDAVAGVVIATTRLCMMRAILQTNKIIVASVLHFTKCHFIAALQNEQRGIRQLRQLRQKMRETTCAAGRELLMPDPPSETILP